MHRLFLITCTLLLAAASSAAAAERGAFIDGEGNVRRGPGTDEPVISVPAAGTRFELVARKGKWIRLRTDAGLEGWTHLKNVKLDPAGAGEALVEPLELDLDGDGRLATVGLLRFKREESGETFRLAVRRGGATVWEDAGPEFPLVKADYGVEEIALAGDTDGDGRVELWLSDAQSDVSPASFRLLRWTAGRFVRVGRGSLIASAGDPVEFPFREAGSAGTGTASTWVMKFTGCDRPGIVRGEIWEMKPVGDAVELRQGEASLKWTGNGFRVARWIRPLAVPAAGD